MVTFNTTPEKETTDQPNWAVELIMANF